LSKSQLKMAKNIIDASAMYIRIKIYKIKYIFSTVLKL